MTINGKSWRKPSLVERDVLRRLVATDFVGSEEISQQIEVCSVREIDENGSLEIAVPPTQPRATVSSRVPAEGEYPDVDGIVIHVLLHIVEGRVNELEVFKEDNSVVHDRDGIAAMKVFAG